jgi:uncharacterized protein YecE (DUF72 family)
MTSFEEFLEKISPLKTANKLGAILFQLPPSLTVGSSYFQVDEMLFLSKIKLFQEKCNNLEKKIDMCHIVPHI